MRRARFLVGHTHACKDLTECLLVQSDDDPAPQCPTTGGSGSLVPYSPPVVEPEVAAMFDGMVLMCGHEQFSPADVSPRACPESELQPEPHHEPEPDPELEPAEQQQQPDLSPPLPLATGPVLPTPRPTNTATPETIVRMVVPAGAKAHDVLTLETESGQRVSMALPAGAAPGSTVQFNVQPSLWSGAGQVVGKLAAAATMWLGRLLDSNPTSARTGGASGLRASTHCDPAEPISLLVLSTWYNVRQAQSLVSVCVSMLITVGRLLLPLWHC